MRHCFFLFLISASYVFLGCNVARGELPPPALSDVQYWAYQIQGLSEDGAIDALVQSRYELLVIEPTRTDWSDQGQDAERFFDTKGMVRRLKASPGADGNHRKLVLAYIDIGQAEEWRWYWTWSKVWRPGAPRPKGWPKFIAVPDPDGWDGNYVVKYWEPAWKDILLHGKNTGRHADRDYVSILDEVVRDGFDGVYLDWVEAYENETVIAAAKAAGKDPKAEMLRLIKEIRAYAAQRTSNFLIIQQNASSLAIDNPQAPRAVDAIAQEEVWYGGIATDDWKDPRGYDAPVDPELTREYIHNLKLYHNAGKPVFACDYALHKASEAYKNSAKHGYVGYATRRSLSRLTTTPPKGVQ